VGAALPKKNGQECYRMGMAKCGQKSKRGGCGYKNTGLSYTEMEFISHMIQSRSDPDDLDKT